MILIVTREDIAANPPSAYQILSHPELRGHASTSGPHTLFTSLRIPASNLLATPGTGASLVERTFALSAALVGAMCVGVMRHAFESALHFCRTETRGGMKMLVEHQSVSDSLISVKMSIDAARALTWRAMSIIERPDESVSWPSRLESAVQAKVWCSEQVVWAVEKCMGVVGIRSYGEDMPFMQILNDAAVLPLFDGGNVGVRRRQLQEIMEGEGYEAWEATVM
jgi:alkylation response protein AidB-like acyl-CoA dehydrogenase